MGNAPVHVDLIIQLQSDTEARFADMIGRYRFSKRSEKFTWFLTDHPDARDCCVKVEG